MRQSWVLAALLGCSPLQSQGETVPPELVPPPSVVTDRQPVAGRDTASDLEIEQVSGTRLPTRSVLSRSGRPLVDDLVHGDAARGAKLFTAYCARCHGRQGRGDGPNSTHLTRRPPDLTRPRHLARLPRAYLYQLVRDGGPAPGRSPDMPPFGIILSDSDIASLIVHLRQMGK